MGSIIPIPILMPAPMPPGAIEDPSIPGMPGPAPLVPLAGPALKAPLGARSGVIRVRLRRKNR